MDTPPPGEGRLLIVKGAPEGIIAVASRYEAGGQALGAVNTVDDTSRQRIQRVYDDASAQGFRVLAVAYRSIEERAAYSAADERDLTLAGFLAFADPPVADAGEMLEELRRDGVQVKIITGDSDLVARHVCTQVGRSGTWWRTPAFSPASRLLRRPASYWRSRRAATWWALSGMGSTTLRRCAPRTWGSPFPPQWMWLAMQLISSWWRQGCGCFTTESSKAEKPSATLPSTC